MRLSRLFLVPMTLLLVLLGVPAAQAEDAVAASYLFEGKLTAEGELQVTETISFDSPPARLTQQLANRAPIDRDRWYEYQIADVQVTGAQEVSVSVDGDYTVISMAPGNQVVISYVVKGATRLEASGSGELSVLTWRALQGLSVAVSQASGTLTAPGMPALVDCTAGPPGTLDKCQLYAAGTHDAPAPMFQVGALGAGEQVSFTVGFPRSQVAVTAVEHESWNLDRAFTVNLTTIGVALAVAAVGGLLLWWLHRRAGMDQGYVGEIEPVGYFRPVGEGESVFEHAAGVRPGLVGTVADERVDPVDITATLLDLAVRGHLRITELEHPQHGLPDWRFSRVKNPDDELARYEALLLDAVVPDGGTSLASELPRVLAPALAEVQSALYDEVVARGWFESRPDSIRNSWAIRGWAAMALAIIGGVSLVAFTRFGLVALVLLALAGGLLWLAPRMPRRTASGTRLVSGLAALAALIATHPSDQMPKGRELVEISRVLPYAVVLGGRQRWLEAMAAADDDELPDPQDVHWYHAPDTWHLRNLPASLTQFINTVQGELFGR